MVYGTDVVLPINLSLPVMKLWQDANEEPNDVMRRINQIIEVHQNRAEVDDRLQKYQDNMKSLFDKKTKDREFLLGDLVLKWDARKEDAGKHDKFDHLWFRPFRIAATEGKNSFLLENLDGKTFDAPINGCYLKILCNNHVSHYHCIYRFGFLFNLQFIFLRRLSKFYFFILNKPGFI
jgi:hypothetical protein